MKISHYQACFRLNLLMMTLLFIGYLLTTGLEIISSDAMKLLFRVVVLLLAISVILLESRIKVAVVFSVYVMALLLALNLNTIGLNIIFILVLVASLTRVTGRDAATIFLASSTLAVLLHILAFKAGLVSSVYTDVEGRVRSALGFKNANQLALIYLTLICSALLVHIQCRTKLSFLALVGAAALSLYMMQVADSRTSIFSVLILIAMTVAARFFSKGPVRQKIFSRVMALFPLLCCGITFYLAANTNPLLDILLSFRPSLFAAFLQDAGSQQLLFGWIPPDEGNVDNAYLMLLSAVGLPVFILIILLLTWRLAHLDLQLLPVMAVILIASIFESFLVRPEIPLAIIFFSTIFRVSGNRQAMPYPVARHHAVQPA